MSNTNLDKSNVWSPLKAWCMLDFVGMVLLSLVEDEKVKVLSVGMVELNPHQNHW